VRRVFVIADSLAFHGATAPQLMTDPRLYPHVLAAELTRLTGEEWQADVVTRFGMTAREAWNVMTKEPLTWSILLPRADAVVLGVGNFDQLPTWLPSWLRDGIPFLRPDALKAYVRKTFHRTHGRLTEVTGARMRILPQHLTDQYLSLCVGGVRHYRPGIPVLGVVPPRHASWYYGHPSKHTDAQHEATQAATHAWARREGIDVVELWPLVEPHLAAGENNSDGMHWGFECHASVGRAMAEQIAQQLVLAPEQAS
jgi:hypothetical protein